MADEIKSEIEKQYLKWTNIKQCVAILISLLFGVNGYQGPVFDNWVGDLIALVLMLLFYLEIRKIEASTKGAQETRSIRFKELEIEFLKLDIQNKQMELAMTHG